MSTDFMRSMEAYDNLEEGQTLTITIAKATKKGHPHQETAPSSLTCTVIC